MSPNGRATMNLCRSAWVLLIASLVAAGLLSSVTSPIARGYQAGSGSVTARVFVCPDSLPLNTVLKSNDPSALLAHCDPSSGPTIAPMLREGIDDTARPGEVFDEGVYLWPKLPFGGYSFEGA